MIETLSRAQINDWEWLSGQFESGWCFNFWAVGEGENRSVTGFVGYPDRNITVVDGRIEWKGDPKRPLGATVYLQLADGSSKTINYHAEGHWPLYKDGAMIMEMFCTYECDGEKGSGVSEHLYVDRKSLLKLPGMVLRDGLLALQCI
ncbi:MAG: hypothetical protein KUG73_13835 [Pseudomonadales bacterium]|nr:hypothetical protein [Pseudomonadales bacterium]